MSDDRPKKSWRELDKMRDGSSHRSSRSSGSARQQERVNKSTAYRSYKSNLDKLFQPGGGMELPDSLKAKLGATDGASSQSVELGKALADKADAPSLKAFLDAGLELPDDARLLMRFLDLDEAELLTPVLQKLLDIVEGGKRPNRMLLIQKIDGLVMRLGDGPVVELAQDLRGALG